ncbi:MAG: ABC transporter permease [Candidatus Competibacteraceae bacterium]|nr:ABC transporter permease [Candidatus Competibacteraceae bacterium]
MVVIQWVSRFWRGVERLSRMVIVPLDRLLEELGFLSIVLVSVGLATRGEWPFLARYTGQQIYFTAVQRTYIFTIVGLIIGALTAFPLIVLGIRDPQILGRIMHLMIYHQLGPILAALFVAGLSGAAITAELGELRANQALDHLTAMGVNPYSFFVFPRLIGMALSLLILNCWLNVGVTVGAALMLNLYHNIPPTVFLRVCVAGLTPTALTLTGGMIVMQATHIVLVQTLRAFQVRAYVDIPRALPNAFTQSFIGCLLISLLFSLVRYG